MLTTDDTVLAREIAEELDRCNTRRQEVEQAIVAEAHRMIADQGGPTAAARSSWAAPGWHPGVIGIVASRLVESYHRPAIVVALGEEVGQGSGRSIPGLDLYEAIKRCGDGLLGFGGHSAAAGLKLPAALLPAFAERFDGHCRGVLTPEQLQKTLTIDAEVQLGMLSPRVVEEIESLEPYGIGNPRPILVANGVRVLGDPRPVGERKNHLQMKFSQAGAVVKAIGWNMAERGKALAANAVCSLGVPPGDQRMERPSRGAARSPRLPSRRGRRPCPGPGPTRLTPGRATRSPGRSARTGSTTRACSRRCRGCRGPGSCPPRSASAPTTTAPCRSAWTRPSASRTWSP